MKKRIISLLLCLCMVFSLLPMSVFAEDVAQTLDEPTEEDEYGIAPVTLDTGHKIDVRFTVLYVGDEFNIGYNYGSSEKTKFVCQYTTNHSDTAYNNHTIAISDIKAAADRASVNSGYQIVGWSKESNANPKVWPLDKSGTTACNKGTTIYLVAKKPVVSVDYTLSFNQNTRDNVTNMPSSQTKSSTTGAVTITIPNVTPQRDGYTFKGWAYSEAGEVQYQPDQSINMSTNVTLYAVWEKKQEEKYEYQLIYKMNDGTDSRWNTDVTDPLEIADKSFTHYVNTGRPTRDGYRCIGWAETPTGDVKYNGGEPILLTWDAPTKTIYAVWTPCNHSYEWVDNGDGTHSEKCTECGKKTDINEAHVDRNNDGKCDKCGADMPTLPTDVPALPGENEKIAGSFYFTCETEVQHYVKTNYDVALQTRNGYTILNRDQGAQKDENGYYFDLQVDATPYLSEYNTQSGKEHTICEGETNPFTIRFHYVEKVWVQDTKPTVKVECNGTQPETPPTKPGVLEGGVTFECENADKAHAERPSTTYTIQPSDYDSISEVQYDAEKNQYYVLADVTLNSTYYLNLYNNWTGATHRISDGQSLTLTSIRFNYEKSTAPGGVASWTQELPVPVVEVTCTNETEVYVYFHAINVAANGTVNEVDRKDLGLTQNGNEDS